MVNEDRSIARLRVRWALRAGASLMALALASGCAVEAGPDSAALQAYGARMVESAKRGALKPVLAPPGPTWARLVAVSGSGIPDMDDGLGDTDAYLVLGYGTKRMETSIAEGPDPVWGDSFPIALTPGGALTVELFDDDTAFDERVAVVTVSAEPLADGEVRTLEIPLRDGARGTLTLRLESLSDAEGMKAPGGVATP